MKLIIIIIFIVSCLFTFIFIDSINYKNNQKQFNIQLLSKQLGYIKPSLQFKSRQYKEFVYVK